MKLEGKRVAILATDGFEQSELESPRDALQKDGAIPTIVAPESGSIRGWRDGDWGDNVDVDVTLAEANPADYAALVLPGGVINPDALRMNDEAVDFVRHFVDSGKPIGAICHGPWTLINADGVKGKRMTSWPSVRTDLENAGAKWEDSEVVVDRGLVTSRNPDDLPAFNAKLIEEVCEGRHAA
jgi:protease I